jgi:predicted DNA-binding transcriptional regulator AlpA
MGSPKVTGPKTHHLDKRATRLIPEIGDGDDLLTTEEVAELFGVSPIWVEIGRSKNYGPPFVWLSGRAVRYRRADLRKWLKSRVHASTAEYRRSEVA